MVTELSWRDINRQSNRLAAFAGECRQLAEGFGNYPFPQWQDQARLLGVRDKFAWGNDIAFMRPPADECLNFGDARLGIFIKAKNRLELQKEFLPANGFAQLHIQLKPVLGQFGLFFTIEQE